MTEAVRTFARGGRSFYFASRWLNARDRERVATVYAYCRATDDLIDEAIGVSVDELRARLDRWLFVSQEAYALRAVSNPLIQAAMADMRQSRIPFAFAEDLVAGVAMDIEPRRYRDFAELGTYTYRVAGVVGLWLSAMFNVRDEWMTERAIALGRAMQLTNIARDVGDDIARERIYLPTTLLASYGVTEQTLCEMRGGLRPISPGFRAVMEAMMTAADADYRRAFEAIPLLPPEFGRTVAVAAEVYRGVHREIRENGYDTLTRRAVTTFGRKCLLGVEGLRRAARAA